MIETVTLPTAHLGTRRTLDVHRFGTPGARPRTYIQAGLHADEIPGLLVAHHLVERLTQAEVTGEVVVVPVANPIGLAQVVTGTRPGRYALDNGGNFNRNFPDLAEAAARDLDGQIGADAQANVRIIRQTLAKTLASLTPANESDALRHALLGLALDADIVLDLHCDQESIVHLYTAECLWPDASDLAARLGARAVLLADESGGTPFDEAAASVWWKLRAQLGHQGPVPLACLAATVELRGQADVCDDLAAADADALFRFLQGRGVVAGDPGPPPAPMAEPTPLAGADRITTPVPGVVVFHHAPGDHITAGSAVADVVAPGGGRTPLRARASGILWARSRHRVAAAGDIVASIAGREPLNDGRGSLLTS